MIGRAMPQTPSGSWRSIEGGTPGLMERCANVMRFGRMTTNTESALNREEFTRHVRMYRRFARGVGLFAALSLAILLLIYSFFGPA
jgi:hypothetical protein